MRIIADLHLHSKYSRACSKDLDLEHNDQWARLKGITVVGTADFTHPRWLAELKEKLVEDKPGLFKLNGSDGNVLFLITTEVSCIYSQGGKVRRIHLCLFAPDFSTVEKINSALLKRGVNLSSDGRPIMGLPAEEVAKIVLDANEHALVIPAHAWTPWFSVFGSKSGFNTIEECFEEYSRYIYAIETGLSCYDTETEVLTENGWKRFSQVTQRDKICTLNSDSEEIEYQKPQKIYRSKYRGKMYRLKTKRADLLITPNHNLLYAPADFHTRRPYRLKEARDLFGKSKILRKDGIWKGETPQYFTLPGVKISHGSRFYSGFRTKIAKKFPIEPWLKFFGFWVAEGWTTKGGNGHYTVCVSNQNYKLMTEMKHILESFGYTVFWDKKVTNTIRVRDYQLFHYLRQFGKAADKHIPAEVRNLSKELLGILLKYYIKGDGHVYGRSGKGLSATTISIRLRNDLQEIALKIGISAYYKLHQRKGTPFASPSQKKIYRQSADSWNIYFIRRNRHAIIPSEMKKYGHKEEWVDYNGMVHCVSVPNRVVYIRRNGIPLWCGNSDPPMNWRLSALDKITLISNSDAHSPRKLGREANVFDTDLSYGAIIGAIKDKDPRRFLYTIEFFPEEGKYHYDGHRNCAISLTPFESKKYNNLCPTCGKPLTIGVLNRVERLADRKQGQGPNGAIPFKSLVPLEEIIAESLGVTTASKRVGVAYENLIKKLGSEFNVLLTATKQDLIGATLPEIAEGIARVREGRVSITPGYDGVYGKVSIFSKGEQKELSKQGTLI